MPIKGRSEIRRIPRIGKIHLGEKKVSEKNGNEFPKATDYFVVKPDDSTSEAAAQAFWSVYGKQPKEIMVAFPHDDPERFFPQYLSSYRMKGNGYELYCRGDGERASRADGQGGYVQIACDYQNCPLYQQKKCKELGKLQVFLPEIPGLGVWQCDTTSYHSMVALNSGIDMIRAFTGGRLTNIKVPLRIVPKIVNPDGRPKTIYHLGFNLEGMTMGDLIKQVSLLPAAAPSVEPIPDDEVPEDLYIPSNIVDGDTVPTESTPDTPNVQTDESDSKVGVVVADVQVAKAKNGQPVGLVRIGDSDSGELVEALLIDQTVLQQAEKIKVGHSVKFKAIPSPHVANRLEIVRLETVFVPAS